MQSDPIRVRGCRVHNLRGVDVDVPRGKLVVVCGLSGSGKTSFALDTLYAEGQRRYIESFSAYTRQFLQRLDKPDCDSITGIPPAIAVTRAGGGRTSRSTVGTATEIADHLRLLFAKIATLHCHGCGATIRRHDPALVATAVRALPESTRLMIGFELALGDREQTSEQLSDLQKSGFQRLIVNGQQFHLGESDRGVLAKAIPRRGTVATVIVDRLTASSPIDQVTESLETAITQGDGRFVLIRSIDDNSASGAGPLFQDTPATGDPTSEVSAKRGKAKPPAPHLIDGQPWL
ncbi:MAG: excinuclease ABC subunit A, partial [Planctomycetaceae bacterium]